MLPKQTRSALPLFMLIGCGSDGLTELNIQFLARAGQEAISCDKQLAAMGQAETQVTISDFRLYISNPTLIAADGTETPISLDQTSPFQNQNTVLLDFEDGTGACGESGTGQMNDLVVGTVPEGDYQGLKFLLGVPFESNHLDVGTAESPLDIASMFWSWRGGHKFVRIDMKNENQAPGDRWFFHLGSVGCDANAPTAAPEAPCTRPNTPEYTFADFAPDRHLVIFDLRALVTGVDLETNTADTPPGCMSDVSDINECPGLFENLGLDFATGACSGDCSSQSVFSLAEKSS